VHIKRLQQFAAAAAGTLTTPHSSCYVVQLLVASDATPATAAGMKSRATNDADSKSTTTIFLQVLTKQ
jgi:hypothetical protein